MYTDKRDWTHKSVQIKDIRKLSEFYIFTISNTEGITDPDGFGVPLMVKDTIFEERLKSYFLKDISKISREEILEVKWNMYITKGYFVKITYKEIIPHDMDSEKYYVSYLEIDGELGTFQSVYKSKDSH